jgi:hypothetical protein
MSDLIKSLADAGLFLCSIKNMKEGERILFEGRKLWLSLVINFILFNIILIIGQNEI